MESNTETLIEALQVLANAIQSGDGVANVCVWEAAARLESLQQALDSATQTNQVLVKRLKIAEEALERMRNENSDSYGIAKYALAQIRGEHG